ncbi:MAG: flavodoxin [Parasporobacterium sp.]|nr:flavodoxin [Parasporobacterium sp.]
MKSLVAYFSAEGTTAVFAKKLAELAAADLFEIRPEKPYTAADLNWKNPLARCNREKIGKKDVPVSGSVKSWEQYDTVYLGFPIWYYAAPNVVSTFCKGYDWSGKTVCLFATSGGSGIGKTAEKLMPYMNGVTDIPKARVLHSEDELTGLIR